MYIIFCIIVLSLKKEQSMEFFKYAIVDIGANSVRMIIYDIDVESGKFYPVDSARNLLGLAAYKEGNRLTADGAGKLSAVIRDYLARANSLPCDKFSAFATASLRGLSNSGELIESIKRRFGVEIEIISGEQEAAYDFEAIRYRFGGEAFPHGTVIDMGGGSTELIRFEGESSKGLTSMPLGCVMLGKKFIPEMKKFPFPNETEILDIQKYTQSVLSENSAFRGKGENVYLIGGTGRALARIHAALSGEDGKNLDGYTFSGEDIAKIREFAAADIAMGAPFIKKALADRVYTVMPGIIAYEQLFGFLGTKRATVTLSGVRDGYLIEFIRRFLSEKTREF
jgi:exopolyphosphatase/guanosine-5'-triphosphate,3'-diphosphate pyrophosphatase